MINKDEFGILQQAVDGAIMDQSDSEIKEIAVRARSYFDMDITQERKPDFFETWAAAIEFVQKLDTLIEELGEEEIAAWNDTFDVMGTSMGAF